MKRLLIVIVTFFILVNFVPVSFGQEIIDEVSIIAENVEDSESLHQIIKTKFVEGSALFMSFIALALIIGLAFCLERIIYLNLSQINTKKFLFDVESQLNNGNVEAAKDIARNTRGPVASICYQALMREGEDLDVIDKSITAYGSVQTGLLEKNLSWISLFIAAAPSLGFLGTVIGMIQAFDNIQTAGDINPTVVAEGMKFALITTVGGLIVALILQLFYNYILNKIEGIVGQMEDDSISILDMMIKYKKRG
ncbi:MotA/TolQ/ExbB proton channel family protein [Bacteroidales bacterium OttesenSCG-928-I14]|nr:MotA/TolQ/ExbB proton channel family protein [Bacteroidales bacterium OttesenSCG-928-I14]